MSVDSKNSVVSTYLLDDGMQGKKNKKYFWFPAIAPLISVIISTFCVYITRADKQGVAIVTAVAKTSLFNIRIEIDRCSNRRNFRRWKISRKVSILHPSIKSTSRDRTWPKALKSESWRAWSPWRYGKFSTTIIWRIVMFPPSNYKKKFTFLGSCRHSSHICWDERLPDWWKQGNGSSRNDEHYRLDDILLCSNR